MKDFYKNCFENKYPGLKELLGKYKDSQLAEIYDVSVTTIKYQN